jgi:hypothetical protein
LHSHLDQLFDQCQLHASQGVEIGSYKLIMMLPMKGSNGQDLTKIHLYPKNKVEGSTPCEACSSKKYTLYVPSAFFVGKLVKFAFPS